MAESYRTPFNSKVAKVSGDVIEDSVGGIKYATSFDGATKIVDENKNKIKIKDGVYNFGKSVNLLNIPDKKETTKNGITYSIKDGVITLNGTCTAKFEPIHLSNLGLENCSYQMFYSKIVSSTSYVNMIMTEDEGWTNSKLINYNNNRNGIYINTNVVNVVRLEIFADTTFDNLQVKLMAVNGSTIPTKYYSGSYGIKIEVADGVMTCNGMLASDTPVDKLWLKFDTILPSGIYSGNIFLNSRQINAWVCHDLYEWANAYQFAVKEHNTPPKANIHVIMDCKYVYFEFGKNYGFDNLVLKPMLVEGTTTPTSFEPYFKNLLEFNDKERRTCT